jgi:hypothetical protein
MNMDFLLMIVPKKSFGVSHVQEYAPYCHILALLAVIPLASPAPHVCSQVAFAFQKSRAAVAKPSLPTTYPQQSL